MTRQELKALFDVIGTPSWVDAESVATPAWRRYLRVTRRPHLHPSLHHSSMAGLIGPCTAAA